MNDKEFAHILRMGLNRWEDKRQENLRDHTRNTDRFPFMCHIIDDMLTEGTINSEQWFRAKNRIQKVIFPWATLSNHLKGAGPATRYHWYLDWIHRLEGINE